MIADARVSAGNAVTWWLTLLAACSRSAWTNPRAAVGSDSRPSAPDHLPGRAGLSHGCINLSTADAKWVYNNFLVGVIVDVKNTPGELPIRNGLGDWTVPFDKYGR